MLNIRVLIKKQTSIASLVKKNALYFLVIILFTGALTSCGDKERRTKSPRIRSLTKVLSPKYGATFSLNDTITFKVSALQDTVSIDSFLVSNGHALLFSSSNSVYHSLIGQTGEADLRFTVFLNNGKKEHYNQKVTFLSDITPENYTYQVINTYAHDPTAYTQGLIYEDDTFYESTGQNGKSSLRKVKLSTGEVLKKINISSQYFGEGIATVDDKIFMLTYHASKGFVYDKTTFEEINTFNFFTKTSEGWGITTMGDSLVMSDGSEYLYFLDPETLSEISRIQVYDQFKPIKNLNELEYINGNIYANIYQTDEIAIIDPASGKLLGKIDLSGIIDQNDYDKEIEVLNGIAYDQSRDRLFVTGKWWPKLFEIDIIKTQLNQ